ncbi:MAG: hypothetical protein HC929_12525 [Leptolyngbyaceae cyanobacterium SM2_5_2]|nr:hypothetical protein [Leptolyngbyaceae cyanobacterium SM2_5_2]
MEPVNPQPHHLSYPELAYAWQSPPALDADPVIRASQYLRVVRQLAPQFDWIAPAAEDQHLAVLTWVGGHIHHLNRQLAVILADLLGCFQPHARPTVQVFAAPIAAKVGLDGFCNFHTQPITLVIDPSRVVRADWSHLVVHELAHAVARTGGHDDRFYQALSYLCLAQDLPPPPPNSLDNGLLRYWPPCRLFSRAERFWRGEAA